MKVNVIVREVLERKLGLVTKFNVPFYFGGTALLIVVGVAIDTIQQIESHMLARHYEGFLKKGGAKRKGRF